MLTEAETFAKQKWQEAKRKQNKMAKKKKKQQKRKNRNQKLILSREYKVFKVGKAGRVDIQNALLRKYIRKRVIVKVFKK